MIDAQEVPRFAGVSTFMRLPHEPDVSAAADLDAAVVGVPFDDATTYRPGARFGPRGIREASSLLKPYNPATDVDLTDYHIVDGDDAPVVPGYVEETFDRIQAKIGAVIDAGAAPAVLGGDHSITLPVLRAVAAEHGPVSLVQFDAHSDLWTEYFGKAHNHGTTVHYAIEEGLIDPATSIRVGDRGGLYGAEDVERYDESGIEYHTMEALDERGPAAIARRIAEVVEGPAFATIDVDVADPAFAPGTGTPSPGGVSSRELRGLVRALRDVDLVGFDHVEVAPPYDADGITTVLGATVTFEALCAMLADDA